MLDIQSVEVFLFERPRTEPYLGARPGELGAVARIGQEREVGSAGARQGGGAGDGRGRIAVDGQAELAGEVGGAERHADRARRPRTGRRR